MKYAILRVQKLKTNTAVRGSLKHAFREQETPNADEAMKWRNQHFGASNVDEAMKAYKERLPEKVRKNGVRCIEYLMTASPEKMSLMKEHEQDAYFKDSLDWLKEKHGEENVVYAGVHRDETTPHMYAYVVPIDERGKLNCRSFIGGTKHKLSELQDEFIERVGEKHGLDRGEKGSKAKHQSIQKYYAKINAPKTRIDLSEANLDRKKLKGGVFSNTYENDEQHRKRVEKELWGQLRTLEACGEKADNTERRLEKFKEDHADLFALNWRERDAVKSAIPSITREVARQQKEKEAERRLKRARSQDSDRGR